MRRVFNIAAAACCAGFSASSVNAKCGSVPFVKLPTTFGFDKCFGNNKGELLKILTQTTLDCSVLKLSDLAKSKPLKEAADLVVSLASSPAKISAALYDHMSSTDANKMDAFCKDYNKIVSPCAEAILPRLLTLAEKDLECCGELSDLADLLNMIAPPTIRKDAFVLQDMLNGVNNLFCTTRQDTPQTCGLSIYSQLTTKYKKKEFHLLEHFLLPFVTMANGEECDGMRGKTYSNTASLKTSSTVDYGCCTHYIRPLMHTIQVGFAQLLGSTPIEFLNGIVEFPNGTLAQFVDSLANTASCNYADSKCTPPSGLMQIKGRDITPGNNNPNTNDLGDTQCGRVKKCDAAGVVCSEICKKGTVAIDPWVAQTLKYQRKLAYAGPICQAQLPATHNSAINLADGFGNRDQLMNANLNKDKKYSYMKTNNHILSMADQLRMGVRWLEIDVHYFLDDLRIAHCGGFGSASVQVLYDVIKAQLGVFGDVLWSPDLLGCFPSLSGIKGEEQRTARSAFVEIRKWLDIKQAQDELVFLYFDTGSEIADLKKDADLDALAIEVFGRLVVPIEQLKTLADNQWTGGANTTIESWINQGYRVVLLANRETHACYQLKSFCKGHAILDTKYINDLPNDERVLGGRKVYGTEYFLRSYQSPLRYITLDERGQISRELPVQLMADNVGNFVRWNINLVATDNMNAATMKAQVWSWAEKEPKTTENAIVVMRPADGRWETVTGDATGKKKACFQAETLTWQLTAGPDPCPDKFKFTGPKDPYQNYLLHKMLQDQKEPDAVVINVPVSIA